MVITINIDEIRHGICVVKMEAKGMCSPTEKRYVDAVTASIDKTLVEQAEIQGGIELTRLEIKKDSDPEKQ